MKQFIKLTLAVICGLFIAAILGFFLFAGCAGVVASSSSGAVVPRSGALVMDMSKFMVADQAKPMNAASALQGSPMETIGIWSLVQAVEKAAEDPGVKFIYLKPDGISCGISHVQEIRQALSNFRRSGKPVISYMENPSMPGYYLATVSDKVFMTSNHGGNSTVLGIGGQLIFLKDLLDKLDVNVQLIRHGKYKSAGEMYTRSEASPENMEQNQVMINSIWNVISSGIADSRGIPVDSLNFLVDDLALNSPEDFLKHSLVDGLMTREELKSKLATYYGVEKFNKVSLIGFSAYTKAKVTANLRAKNKIAVIYAEGNIVEGEDLMNVDGDRFSEMIASARADSSVKAVVLRVNSPGGSVLASDKIRTEVDLTRKDKPVIASYGNYAASGGYWISSSCDRIFSEATTLTGSIGVFGMIPEFSKTLKNIAHVNITSVKSNRHSDMYSLTKPFDSKEYAYMQASIEDIYTRFVGLVSEGRNLTTEFVDSVAQGRVWTGIDALKLGLVDELGSLKDAVSYAALKASPTGESDLSKWNIAEYPQPMSLWQQLMLTFSENGNEVPQVFAGTPFEQTATIITDWARDWRKARNGDVFFARMPYEFSMN